MSHYFSQYTLLLLYTVNIGDQMIAVQPGEREDTKW